MGTTVAWASSCYFHEVHAVFYSLELWGINPLYCLWIASISLVQFASIKKKRRRRKKPPHFVDFYVSSFDGFFGPSVKKVNAIGLCSCDIFHPQRYRSALFMSLFYFWHFYFITSPCSPHLVHVLHRIHLFPIGVCISVWSSFKNVHLQSSNFS